MFLNRSDQLSNDCMTTLTLLINLLDLMAKDACDVRAGGSPKSETSPMLPRLLIVHQFHPDMANNSQCVVLEFVTECFGTIILIILQDLLYSTVYE